MPAPPTNASASFTVPDGVRPAMLWAVGTSVGIGEDAQPEIISRIITASAECVRPELRPRRRLTSKLILAPDPLMLSAHQYDSAGCQIRLGPTACAHHRALVAAGHARPGNGGDRDRIEGTASRGMRRIVVREGNWHGKVER